MKELISEIKRYINDFKRIQDELYDNGAFSREIYNVLDTYEEHFEYEDYGHWNKTELTKFLHELKTLMKKYESGNLKFGKIKYPPSMSDNFRHKSTKSKPKKRITKKKSCGCK